LDIEQLSISSLQFTKYRQSAINLSEESDTLTVSDTWKMLFALDCVTTRLQTVVQSGRSLRVSKQGMTFIATIELHAHFRPRKVTLSLSFSKMYR
jgi:hypothetical protein